MKLQRWVIGAVAFVMVLMSLPACADSPEESLKVYAAHIQKSVPFTSTFAGFAIYLGEGRVITAAHVVGRWPLLTRPTVHIASLDLPARVIKLGSVNGIDVALLKIDEQKLPIRLRLRRNPLCATEPRIGEEVFAVVPDKVVGTRIFSPMFIPEPYRRTYNTLLPSVVTASGSGIFRGKTKCLLGIQSKAVTKYKYRRDGQEEPDGFAGYFVPSTQIISFFGPKNVPLERNSSPGSARDEIELEPPTSP